MDASSVVDVIGLSCSGGSTTVDAGSVCHVIGSSFYGGSTTVDAGSVVDSPREDKSSGAWTCRNVTWCGGGKGPYFDFGYTDTHGLRWHTCNLISVLSWMPFKDRTTVAHPETPFTFDFVFIQSTFHLHTIMSSIHRTQNSSLIFPIWFGVNDMATYLKMG